MKKTNHRNFLAGKPYRIPIFSRVLSSDFTPKSSGSIWIQGGVRSKPQRSLRICPVQILHFSGFFAQDHSKFFHYVYKIYFHQRRLPSFPSIYRQSCARGRQFGYVLFPLFCFAKIENGREIGFLPVNIGKHGKSALQMEQMPSIMYPKILQRIMILRRELYPHGRKREPEASGI